MNPKGFRRPFYVIYTLAAIFAACVFSIMASSMAQNRAQSPREETYTRPEPTKPIKPSIPDEDRFQDDKVFLEYADSLFRPANEYEEFQIVKGSVKFRHGGMWMFCDSAYYYPNKNSMDAFGHVEMQQGDTLFVYADQLYYDGMSKHAILVKGPSQQKVVLRNNEVTLSTDSLDYDVETSLGWYTTGGELVDDVNTLNSLYGEYSPASKLARFRTDVVLVNNKDGYRLTTNELDYSTLTHVADINTPTRIEGANDTIVTTRGFYDTQADRAQLLSRSTIFHSDSLGRVTTLQGDSIIYDKALRISRAYMFADPFKRSAPMIINDTARKVKLIGGFGEYNDSTREAFATQYPMLIEYSRPDSLFLRADTIYSFIENATVIPKLQLDSITQSGDTVYYSVDDSLAAYNKDFHVARAIGRARFFNSDLQGVADTLFIREQDSMLYMLKKPVVWTGERQIYGNRIDVHFNDSTADWAELPQSGMVAEHIAEDFYNQLTGSYMKAYFKGQTLRHLDVEGNVIAIMLPQEKDSTYNKLVHTESSYLTLDMDSNQVEHMKMWPEVTGYVAPLFEVKKAQQFIEGFRWLESLRPVRQWYGSEVRWADELGEVPDELEAYFNQPPLFKVIPKPVRNFQTPATKPSAEAFAEESTPQEEQAEEQAEEQEEGREETGAQLPPYETETGEISETELPGPDQETGIPGLDEETEFPNLNEETENE